MALSHGKSETSQEKRHGKPCDSPGISQQDPQRPGTPEMEVTISPMEPVRTRRQRFLGKTRDGGYRANQLKDAIYIYL